MSDIGLSQQHAWTLQAAQAAEEKSSSSDDSSDEINSWVMLRDDGNIVPLHNERILHKSRSRVALDIATPRELPNAEKLGIRSNEGIAYITNRRVIYLPDRPTEEFKSFFAPILNFEDTHVHSSWIGPWSWSGLVKPVTGGGIPVGLPRIDVKLTFKDGGHADWQSKFELLKERLSHARDLERETGQTLIVTDEDLPPYEASGPANPPSVPPPSETAQPSAETITRSRQPPQPAPDEPPPDYVEAQSQAIGMRFEEQLRDEAERH